MFSQIKKIAVRAIFVLLLLNAPVHAGQLSVSNEVQANIKVLTETKNCPGCDLKGAVLNRLDLDGANLEGANLSRAKLFLSNLANANLKNSNLAEAEFGGADLANADLRGANLTATSFAGAYMVGTLLDGEMISAKPYADDDISQVEEEVYVDDTVKPKVSPSTEDINIGSRRDFEETSQEVIVKSPQQETATEEVTGTETAREVAASTIDKQEENIPGEEQVEGTIPEVSTSSPRPKAVPAIQSVQIEEIIDETVEESVVEKEDQEVDAVFETAHIPTAADSDPQPTTHELKALEEQNDDIESSKERQEDGLVEKTIETRVSSETNSTVATAQSDAQEKESDVIVAEKNVNPETQKNDSTVNETPIIIEEADKEQVQTVSENAVDSVDSLNNDREVTENQEAVPVETVQEAAKALPAIEEIKTLSKEVYANMERLLDDNSCYGCDLTDVNLSGENLDSADLEGAILVNAMLTGADLEQANLKGANLSGANLQGADLSEADLYKANLSGADLTGAKLEDTLLDDADLNGVKGYSPAIPLFPGQ